MAVGKNIKRKRGKGKQYHLPYNIKSVGKNIKLERGDLEEILGKKIKIKKMGVGKNIKLPGPFYTLWGHVNWILDIVKYK